VNKTEFFAHLFLHATSFGLGAAIDVGDDETAKSATIIAAIIQLNTVTYFGVECTI
jgi:hypothetical protein